MSPVESDRPLPELSELRHKDALAHALSLLLEPTPTLHDLLVPQVLSEIEKSPQSLQSYNELIDISQNAGRKWSYEDKGKFIHGHPKIGAPAAKISALSGKEQSAGPVTPQVVLDR